MRLCSKLVSEDSYEVVMKYMSLRTFLHFHPGLLSHSSSEHFVGNVLVDRTQQVGVFILFFVNGICSLLLVIWFLKAHRHAEVTRND